MSEWMNISELLSTIKEGQIVENDDNVAFMTLKNGNLIYCNRNGEKVTTIGSYGDVILNVWALNCKYKLLPSYVSFEEARDALKDGYTVSSYFDDQLYDKYTPDSKDYECIEWIEIIEGKWIIEN